MPDPKPERPDVSDYLECSDSIDYNHPLVEDAADQLTYGLKDNLTKARAIYDFVKDQIFNSFQINATSVTIKASEVIDKGHGVCYAKAHLLAALMRASDIPAGLCYQLRYDDETEQVIVHGFNAVYIKELNKWIRLDASRHTDDDQWRFDPSCESPELSIDKSIGEYDDYIVYLSPSKRVMKALNTSDTLDELRDRLPVRI